MQRAEGPVTGCCEHGNEILASMSGGELCDDLGECHPFRKDCSSHLIILERLKISVRNSTTYGRASGFLQ
jgi:hypothetical protein